jgi:triosephosphate isomerase
VIESRFPIISGNWKMNLNHLEAIGVTRKIIEILKETKIEVSIHPPFTSLRSVQTTLADSETTVQLGAQNCHWEDDGPYTGEVSAEMLAKLEVTYVIVGHSERRKFFSEDDETINSKILKVLQNEMSAILCVGETIEERNSNSHFDTVRKQLLGALSGIPKAKVSRIVVAYEPVWAIGTGLRAESSDIAEMAALIRKVLKEIFGSSAARDTRIQYGGSVNEQNAKELVLLDDIDGALIGGASLSPSEFCNICQLFEKEWNC